MFTIGLPNQQTMHLLDKITQLLYFVTCRLILYVYNLFMREAWTKSTYSSPCITTAETLFLLGHEDHGARVREPLLFSPAQLRQHTSSCGKRLRSFFRSKNKNMAAYPASTETYVATGRPRSKPTKIFVDQEKTAVHRTCICSRICLLCNLEVSLSGLRTP